MATLEFLALERSNNMQQWLKNEINKSAFLLWLITTYKTQSKTNKVKMHAILAVIAALLLFWLVLNPSYEVFKSSLSDRKDSVQMYNLLIDNAAALQAAKPQEHQYIKRSSNELSQIVTRLSGKLTLDINSIASQGSNRLKISYMDVEFSKVAKLIVELEKQSVTIHSMSVVPEKNGIVSISFVLT